jgi:hypothetical protein
VTGLFVIRNAAEQPVGMSCACETAVSRDRASPSRRRSRFGGRVLGLGHRAGEPIATRRNPHVATEAARALAEQRRLWICTAIVTAGLPPPETSVGVSRSRAGTRVDRLLRGPWHCPASRQSGGR